LLFESFLYICLILGILFTCISAHLTVLLLLNPILNLGIFLLLLIMSSHPHRFDFRSLVLYEYVIGIAACCYACVRFRRWVNMKMNW